MRGGQAPSPARRCGHPWASPLLCPPVRDINLSLWRQPELVKFDRSVFMNQGEWELLYVLSHFQEFSVNSSDSYAEIKFYVRVFGPRASQKWGAREAPCPYPCCLITQLLPAVLLLLWAGGCWC